jgi:predicted transcriptional regulator
MTDLEYQARRALTELARSRTCSLGGISTGNLLRVRERAFIVTAKHVADDFYKLKRPRVIFRHNYKILSEQSEYVSSTDDSVDIALIAVNNLKAEAVSYGYEDFKFIDDFRTYDFDRVMSRFSTIRPIRPLY